jgi:hypothetical protein
MKRPKFMEEFFHGKLSDCVEAGEGASNQLQGSSKFDAPAMISTGHGLDIDMRYRTPSSST